MMGLMDHFFRCVFYQFHFNGIRRFGRFRNQSNSSADAEYMGVNRHVRLRINYRGYYIGCFPADTRFQHSPLFLEP